MDNERLMESVKAVESLLGQQPIKTIEIMNQYMPRGFHIDWSNGGAYLRNDGVDDTGYLNGKDLIDQASLKKDVILCICFESFL